jgi:hypothetical protein
MCSALEIFAAVDASLHVIAPLRRSVRLAQNTEATTGALAGLHVGLPP